MKVRTLALVFVLLAVLFVYSGGNRSKEGIYFGADDAFYIHASPNNKMAYQDAILELGKSNELSVTIPYYKELTEAIWAQMSQDYLDAFTYVHASYPEFFSNKPDFSISIKSLWNRKHQVTLVLNNKKMDDEELLHAEEAFRLGILRHLAILQQNGQVGGNLSSKEEISNVFHYVVGNVTYKLEESDPLAYSGYSASERGYGVCQGYVAMFHGILNHLGYETLGISGYVEGDGTPHQWSRVKVDGIFYYFDPTFADSKQASPEVTWEFLTMSQINQGRVLDFFQN